MEVDERELAAERGMASAWLNVDRTVEAPPERLMQHSDPAQ
jgi:hypothetical protein